MRSDIDDGYLAELAEDIKRNGLINPVSVRQVGQRYEVIAGHCRTLACRALNLELIAVRDYTNDGTNPEAIKVAENVYRQDVSDADMALYLHDLVHKHNYDCEKLTAMTGKGEDWITRRLALIDGDKRIFDAVLNKKINLGTALVLNKFPEDYLAMYLQLCIDTTPPTRLVQDWLAKLKAQVLQAVEPAQLSADNTPATPLPGVVVEACEICGGNQMPWEMKFIRVHNHCAKMIVDAVNKPPM